jgi:hypothetical protein
MPDETDLDQGLEDFDFDGPFDEERAKRALLASRRAEKAAKKRADEAEGRVQALERQTSFRDLQTQFGDFLTPDDFEGLEPDKWEARATRLAELRSDAKGEAGEKTSQGQTVQEPKPEEAALAQAERLNQQTAQSSGLQPISASEAAKAYQSGSLSPHEVADMVRKGLIKTAR